jgi:hypothetical protein
MMMMMMMMMIGCKMLREGLTYGSAGNDYQD